jgi:acetyl-CoA carboxylase beta subunit
MPLFIKTKCPKCEKLYYISHIYSGLNCKCALCRSNMVIPSKEPVDIELSQITDPQSNSEVEASIQKE